MVVKNLSATTWLLLLLVILLLVYVVVFLIQFFRVPYSSDGFFALIGESTNHLGSTSVDVRCHLNYKGSVKTSEVPSLPQLSNIFQSVMSTATASTTWDTIVERTAERYYDAFPVYGASVNIKVISPADTDRISHHVFTKGYATKIKFD